MSTAEFVVTNPATSHGRGPQHPANEVASLLAQLAPAPAGGEAPSIRALARKNHLPESTIRSWRDRVAQAPGLEPEAIAFFTSPAGIRFLHKLIVALLFVLGLMGGCGPSLLRLFLQMTGLDALVACSDTTLRKRMKDLLAAVGKWGEAAQKELAVTMPLCKLSLGVDETFFARMVLVALDMVSGYCILEKISVLRDANTWNEQIQTSLVGLKVELVQVVGDGATALRKLAEDLLGIPKVDDLWHIQHAISAGTAGPLAAQVEQATNQLTAAHDVEKSVAQERAAYEHQPHGSGRPPNWDKREANAAQAVQTAAVALNEAISNQNAMGEAICDLGVTLHPVNLTTGTLQDAEQVKKGLLIILIRMLQIALHACLGERSRVAIHKLARVIPSWVAMVARWHVLVEERLAALNQQLLALNEALAEPPAVVALVRNILIPVMYLGRVIQQTRDAARRQELRAVRSRLLETMAEPGGVWRTLPVALRHSLLAMAQDCVDLFQRSTGCVEGRNGYLSLHQHQMRGLEAPLLNALTVVHNFVLTRADGTTAAVRFFGQAPKQELFPYLCLVLALPARPRKRARLPREDLLFTTITEPP